MPQPQLITNPRNSHRVDFEDPESGTLGSVEKVENGYNVTRYEPVNGPVFNQKSLNQMLCRVTHQEDPYIAPVFNWSNGESEQEEDKLMEAPITNGQEPLVAPIWW